MIKKTILLGFSIVLLGCSSSGSRVVAANPKESSYIDNKYSIHDLHIHVHAMVTSMLKTPKVFKDNPTPKIAIGDIHIGSGIEDSSFPVDALRRSIRTNLMESGKVEIIDIRNIKLLEKQLDYQNSSKYIKKAQSIGQFVAMEYLLTGDVSKRTNFNSKVSRSVTVLNMKLTHVATGTLRWSEEKEIHKDLLK